MNPRSSVVRDAPVAERSKRLRHKHLKLDQAKIDIARAFFGVPTEQEAIDLALDIVAAEADLRRALSRVKGVGGFVDPWK